VGTDKRGPYAKGLARRRAILDAAARAFARSGRADFTLKELAAEAGLSERGVSHYFASREDLLVAIVQERAQHDGALRAGEGPLPSTRALADLITSAGVGSEDTIYAQLYLSLAVGSMEPDHPARPTFVDRYARLRVHLAALLVRDGIADESASVPMATALIATVNGLQIQWQLFPQLDVKASLDLVAERFGIPLDPGDVGDHDDAGHDEDPRGEA